jgi:hypothetical protein
MWKDSGQGKIELAPSFSKGVGRTGLKWWSNPFSPKGTDGMGRMQKEYQFDQRS